MFINIGMSSTPCQPPQPFRNNKFAVTIGREGSSVIESMITAVNIPDMAINDAPVVYNNREGWVPGNRVNYGTVDVEFIVDAELTNYLWIYEWMLQNRNHQNFFAVDMTYTIYSAKNNVVATVKFISCFPKSISSIPLNSQELDPQPVKASSVFQFDRLEVKVTSTGKTLGD